MKSVLNLHKCQKCGLCCYLQTNVVVEGKQFIPVPLTVGGFSESEKKYLSLQVCVSFDRRTRKCKDYENRSLACKKFDCKGKATPQVLSIEGLPTRRIKPEIVIPNRGLRRRNQ